MFAFGYTLIQWVLTRALMRSPFESVAIALDSCTGIWQSTHPLEIFDPNFAYIRQSFAPLPETPGRGLSRQNQANDA
ncbi:MAG TPA: hypothetical protein VF133_16210 [Terriglobales bacterium]